MKEVPRKKISCDELVKFMKANRCVNGNFYTDKEKFTAHRETFKTIETRLGSKINSLDDDLII